MWVIIIAIFLWIGVIFGMMELVNHAKSQAYKRLENHFWGESPS